MISPSSLLFSSLIWLLRVEDAEESEEDEDEQKNPIQEITVVMQIMVVTLSTRVNYGARSFSTNDAKNDDDGLVYERKIKI